MSDSEVVFKFNLNTIEQTYDDLTVDEATIEQMVNDGYSLTEENVITEYTQGIDFIRNSNYFKTINVLYRKSASSELELYSFNPLEGRINSASNSHKQQCRILLEPLIYALNNFVSIKQDNLKYLNLKLGSSSVPIIGINRISRFLSYNYYSNADDYIEELIFSYPLYYKNVNKVLTKEDTLALKEVKNMLFKFVYLASPTASSIIGTSEYLQSTKAAYIEYKRDNYSYISKYISHSIYSNPESDSLTLYWSSITKGKDNYITCTFKINEPEYGWGVIYKSANSSLPDKIYYDTVDVIRDVVNESNLKNAESLGIYPGITFGGFVLKVFPFNNKTYLLLSGNIGGYTSFNLNMDYIIADRFPNNPFKELNANSPIDTSDYYSGYIVINEKYKDFISKKHNLTVNTAFIYNSGYSNLHYNVYITIDGKLQIINYTKVDAEENGVRSINSFFGKEPLFSSNIFYGNIYTSLCTHYPVIHALNYDYNAGSIDYSMDIYDIEVGIGTYEYIPELTAYITADRDPVIKGEAKPLTLTCHVDDIIDSGDEVSFVWYAEDCTDPVLVIDGERMAYITNLFSSWGQDLNFICNVYQGDRQAVAHYTVNIVEASKKKPIAVISPQEKPYIEHMLGKFYATNSYDINDPVSPIVKYIWNGVETVSPIFTTRVKKTDIITLQVVNALGEISEPVQVDLSQEYDQWGNKYKFLDIPMFLVCSKGSSLFDTLISRFPIPTNTNDLYTSRYDTEYPEYTRIGFTTDISSDTITYMACLPQYGVAEYKAPREQVDIYPLGISWLEKRNMLKYFDKTKNSKGSLLACIGHPELGEEGYSSLEWVLNSLGILTPKERYSIPRLLDLLELLLMGYENGGLIKL